MAEGDTDAAAALKAEGNALFKAGKLAAAVDKYSEAIAARAEPAFYFNRGVARLRMRGGEAADAAALADLRAATDADAGYAKAWARQAEACLRCGDIDAARAAAASALAADPESQACKDAKALVERVEARAGSARAALGAYLTREALLSAEAEGAAVAFPSPEFAGTDDADAPGWELEDVLEALPAAAVFMVDRARALHAARRYRSAERVALAASNGSGSAAADARFVVAWSRFATGDFGGAVTVLQEALRLDPDDAGCGVALQHAKRLADAKEAANATYRGGDHAAAAEAYAAANEHASKLLEGGVGTLLSNLAAAKLAVGALDDALNAAEAAVAADPFSPKTLGRKAAVLSARGDHAGATEALRQAQWLSPGDESLADKLYAAQQAAAKGGTPPSQVVHVNDEDEWAPVVRRAGSKVILVDYFASWCGPCKQIAPLVEALAVRYSNVVVVKMDGDACQELVMEAGVSAYPTFHVYRNGQRLEEMRGADPAGLSRMVAKYAAQSGAADPASGRLADAPPPRLERRA